MILKYIGLLGINTIRDSEIPQPKLQSTLQTMSIQIHVLKQQNNALTLSNCLKFFITLFRCCVWKLLTFL